MIYSNDSLDAILSCERARTGNYGLDEYDYEDDYDEDEDESEVML